MMVLGDTLLLLHGTSKKEKQPASFHAILSSFHHLSFLPLLPPSPWYSAGMCLVSAADVLMCLQGHCRLTVPHAHSAVRGNRFHSTIIVCLVLTVICRQCVIWVCTGVGLSWGSRVQGIRRFVCFGHVKFQLLTSSHMQKPFGKGGLPSPAALAGREHMV